MMSRGECENTTKVDHNGLKDVGPWNLAWQSEELTLNGMPENQKNRLKRPCEEVKRFLYTITGLPRSGS